MLVYSFYDMFVYPSIHPRVLNINRFQCINSQSNCIELTLIICLQIIFSVSKSHNSFNNCDSEQFVLYTNLHIMDDIVAAVEMVQSKALLQNRG